jgi:hypothetical protein
MSASNQRYPVNHDLIFPHGCYLISEVEPVRDFDKSTRDNFVQALDKVTGLRVWSAMAHDADPEVRKGDRTVEVKFLAEVQPVPPPTVAGTPFRPVEFEGLTVTPYVDDKACKPARPGEQHRCRARIAYSLRAVGMRAPRQGGNKAGASDAA